MIVEAEKAGATPPGYVAAITASGAMAYYRWSGAGGAMADRLAAHVVGAGPDWPASIMIVDAAGRAYLGAVSAEGEPTIRSPK